MAETTAGLLQPEEVALYSLVECAARCGAVIVQRLGRTVSHHAEVTV